MSIWQVNSKPSSISCEKRIRKRKSFYEKPVIGITGNEKTHPDDDIMMSYAAKGFVEGVKDAGGIPIILPIGDQEMASHYISLIDKLILTGGQNVDPKFYGEPKTIDSDDYHLQRDTFELALIKEAINQKKPIFFCLSWDSTL